MRFRLVHCLGTLLAIIVIGPMIVVTFHAPASSASSLQSSSTPDVSSVDDSGIVDIPERWECETAPKGLLDILGLLNDVEMAQYSDRIGTIVEAEVVQGSPLSVEDSAGIAWTLRQLAACANGVDPLRVLPLLSDDLVTALLANVENADELSGALESLPLFASETLDQGGLPAFDAVSAWYDQNTSKRIWAVIDVPMSSEDADDIPPFLVSFIYDEYFWVADSVWTIES